MTEEKYHLFVAPFTETTAAIAMSERYALATASHVMIYRTNPECPESFREMTEENLHLLPDESLKWLREMNITIIQDFRNRKMEEQERANKKFLEDFERELEAEKQKLLQQRGDRA